MLRNKLTWQVYILPCFLYLLIFFVLPTYLTLVSSFKKSLFDTGWSFYWYAQILTDENVLKSILYTLGYTVISSILSVVLAIWLLKGILHYKQRHRGEKLPLWLKILEFPMMMPYLASAFMISLLLQQYGFVSAIAYALGWIHQATDFPIIVNDLRGIGIITSYVWKTAPFIVLVNLPMLLKLDIAYGDQYQVLGIEKEVYFKRIILPLLRRGLVVSGCIVFSFVLTAVEIPSLLGVTYPKAIGVMALQIFQTGELSERPLADALNVIQIIIVLISIGVAQLLAGKHYEIES